MRRKRGFGRRPSVNYTCDLVLASRVPHALLCLVATAFTVTGFTVWAVSSSTRTPSAMWGMFVEAVIVVIGALTSVCFSSSKMASLARLAIFTELLLRISQYAFKLLSDNRHAMLATCFRCVVGGCRTTSKQAEFIMRGDSRISVWVAPTLHGGGDTVSSIEYPFV
jgi:hypothetical protein